MSSLSLKQINQIVSSEKLVGMFPLFLDTPPMLKYKYPVAEWEKLKSCRVPYPDWSGDSVFEWENGNRKKGGKIIGKKSGKGVMGMKVFRFIWELLFNQIAFNSIDLFLFESHFHRTSSIISSLSIFLSIFTYLNSSQFNRNVIYGSDSYRLPSSVLHFTGLKSFISFLFFILHSFRIWTQITILF